MHDAVSLEEKGIPTVAVATTEFLEAARSQAAELGMPQYSVVTVAHPIQPLTEKEVRARADSVINEVLARVCGA